MTTDEEIRLLDHQELQTAYKASKRKKFSSIRTLAGRLTLTIACLQMAIFILLGAIRERQIEAEAQQEAMQFNQLTDRSHDQVFGKPDKKFEHEKKNVANTFVIFGLATIFCLFILTNKMLSPLSLIEDGLKKLSKGNFDVTLTPRGSEDLVSIMKSFNRTVKLLKELHNARGQFLLDASHELRSPLARMRLTVAMLPQSEPLRAQLQNDIAELSNLATALLDAESSLEDRFKLSKRNYNFENFCGWLSEALRTFEVDFEFDANQHEHAQIRNLSLEISPFLLRRVIQNLSENAKKYSEGRPRVSLNLEGDFLSLRFQDNGGKGYIIAPEAFEKVFEPFYRTDLSRSRDSGGFGLGLYLCRRIMNTHGGTIWVAESSLKNGTTIISRLPVQLQNS